MRSTVLREVTSEVFFVYQFRISENYLQDKITMCWMCRYVRCIGIFDVCIGMFDHWLYNQKSMVWCIGVFDVSVSSMYRHARCIGMFDVSACSMYRHVRYTIISRLLMAEDGSVVKWVSKAPRWSWGSRHERGLNCPSLEESGLLISWGSVILRKS